ADPAVLNLTAFETFFQERRPFFVAGTGVFRFDVNCSQVNCNGERLFYSRRIGRAPQLPGNDPSSPIATTIYGAAKVTGRLPGGQTVGVLDAITQRATGSSDRTTEPATNYAVLRGQQDFRKGGGRGSAAVRQSGWRDYPVRDELSAPVPGLRGERLGLPAARRPAELEYLVRSAVAPSELSVSDRVLELQLVAILDGRRAAG